MDAVTFDTLDAEWQRVKDTLQGTDVGLRMRRATSWIECAAKADDDDARFIFYWIAFNAAYQPVAKSPLHATDAASRLNCVVRRSHRADLLPPQRLVSRAPRPSRCDAGFRHGLLWET